MSRTAARRWVGLDGEGVGRAPHRYVLLAAYDAKGRGDSIASERGLSTMAALGWLVTTWSSKDVRLCGYFLQYDWTMILRDLPNKALYRLFRPELRALPGDEGGGFSWVHHGPYRLHWIGGAMHVKKHGGRAVTVWDMGKYYQQSFVQSLRDWKTIPEVEIEAIASMKSRRDTFTDADTAEVTAYCKSECVALAMLAAQLEAAHTAADLRPRAWHGPGSTASALLRRERVRDHRGAPPDEAREPIARAFFGGRFEHATIGRIPDVWGYDVASAYPYAMTRLPCLKHAQWEHVQGDPRDRAITPDWYLARCEVTDVGARQWGPLPIRLDTGSIIWPRTACAGWYWSPEAQSAQEGWEGVHVTEAWLLHEHCDCRPFEWVLPLYRYRLSLGKEAKGRVVKLALNSCYGQIARSVGGGGPFSSRTWAGMITATTRAQLLHLLARYDDQVVAVATDGLYSRSRLALPEPPLAPDTLGAWEEKHHGPMTLVRPGIYYGDGDEAIVRARGVGRRQMQAQRAAVSDAIEHGDERASLGTSVLFGGAKACIWQVGGTYRRSAYYGEWHEAPARISLAPGPKRAEDWSPPRGMGRESRPYRPGGSPATRLASLLEALKDARR